MKDIYKNINKQNKQNTITKNKQKTDTYERHLQKYL